MIVWRTDFVKGISNLLRNVCRVLSFLARVAEAQNLVHVQKNVRIIVFSKLFKLTKHLKLKLCVISEWSWVSQGLVSPLVLRLYAAKQGSNRTISSCQRVKWLRQLVT